MVKKALAVATMMMLFGVLTGHAVADNLGVVAAESAMLSTPNQATDGAEQVCSWTDPFVAESVPDASTSESIDGVLTAGGVGAMLVSQADQSLNSVDASFSASDDDELGAHVCLDGYTCPWPLKCCERYICVGRSSPCP